MTHTRTGKGIVSPSQMRARNRPSLKAALAARERKAALEAKAKAQRSATVKILEAIHDNPNRTTKGVIAVVKGIIPKIAACHLIAEMEQEGLVTISEDVTRFDLTTKGAAVLALMLIEGKS